MGEKKQWEEISVTSDIKTAPAAGSDLVVHETTQDVKVESIEISAGEANWFKVIIRDHNAANPVVQKIYRLNSDGQLIVKGDFDDPIFTYEANREITVQNVNAGAAGVNYGVNLKLWERKRKMSQILYDTRITAKDIGRIQAIKRDVSGDVFSARHKRINHNNHYHRNHSFDIHHDKKWIFSSQR